jgi:tRNA(fMet)-specific endonuclease VapC
MGILIDSNIVIDAEQVRDDITARAHAHSDAEFFISVITASELLHGVHRATQSHIKAARLAFVEAVLTAVPVLPIGLPIARVHSQLWADLKQRGEMIGAHDLWLAATCLAHGLTLATRDVRDFQRVPGLTIEHWT